MVFSRVSIEHSAEISHQALMRGLEHDVLPLEDESWVTFQFLTKNSKNAFDGMVRDLGYTVEGDSPVQRMIDQVVSGRPPLEIIEGLTKGIKNAMAKGRVKHNCPDCGFSVPVYGGRYPSKCPECGAAIGKE